MASELPSGRWQRPYLVLLTSILVFALLYWARSVLIPVALAMLLTFLLAPAVGWLQRKGLGRTLSVAVVVTLAFALLGVITWLIVAQVAYLGQQLGGYEKNITKKIDQLRTAGQGTFLTEVQGTVQRVLRKARQPAEPSPQEKSDQDNINQRDPKKPLPVPPVPVIVQQDESDPWSVPITIAPVSQWLASAGLVIVLVIFMLISREDLRNRLIRLIGRGRVTVTTRALDDAAQRISRYLQMQLVINGTYGLAAGIGFYLIGVPHAALWGFLAAIFRYIPYIGPWIAALFPILMSLLASDGWSQPLVVVGFIIVLELISNNIVEPLLYGHSVGVSPVPLLIAAAFWTWLWGPIGLILSAPLTTCLLVLGKYFPYLEFLDVLLGNEPVLEPHIRYYQRLLARDEDEAADLVEEQLKLHSPEAVYDELLVPALVMAKRDRAHGELTADDERHLLESTRAILGEVIPETEEREPDVDAAAARALILGCSARDGADELALEMFRRLVAGPRCEVELMGAEAFSSEIIAAVEEKDPHIVCVAALPPGGMAHTRYLCKRLRSRFPDLKILVGRWGFKGTLDAQREQLVAAGADEVAATLCDTCKQVGKLARLVPHLEPELTR